jgi:hypothetical protein
MCLCTCRVTLGNGCDTVTAELALWFYCSPRFLNSPLKSCSLIGDVVTDNKRLQAFEMLLHSHRFLVHRAAVGLYRQMPVETLIQICNGWRLCSRCFVICGEHYILVANDDDDVLQSFLEPGLTHKT